MSVLTIAEVQMDQQAKLLNLNASSRRTGGRDVEDEDPREIAMTIAGLALNLQLAALMEGGQRGADTADALAAQCTAYRLALARVENLDITSGEAA